MTDLATILQASRLRTTLLDQRPKGSYHKLQPISNDVTILRIGRSSLTWLLLVVSAFPAMFAPTVSSQQYTTETVGYATTTFVSLSNTTIISLSNVTETIVQTNTLTSQVTVKNLSSTQITITETLPSVNVKTVEPSFLEANAGWLLPLLGFVGVFALLLVAGRIVRIEK
jgi:hypothetical protein